MKIDNPFNAKHVRCTMKIDGDKVLSVQSDARQIEIDERCTEVLLEAVNEGRNDSPAWSNRMWVKDRGMMDVKEYQQLLSIEKERRELEAAKEKEAKRREKEARDRNTAKESVYRKKEVKEDKGEK